VTLGREPAASSAPPAAIAPRTTNVAAHPPSKLARALMERGLLATTTDGVATVLGRAPRTFEDYVVRVAGAGAWHR
jgi:hypothetical protein